MKLASLSREIEFGDGRPAIRVLLDSEAGKEIRIVFMQGQAMREHKAPAPIVVEVFEGSIDFGVEGKVYTLERGDLIALDANVSHDLLANEDSIVRLSLHKSDSAKRVEEVVK